MTSKQPLNSRQLDVLRWIADGCPDGRWEDFSYKTTCYALAARDLADVDRRPESWSASITDAGTYYLAHERFAGSSLKDLLEREAAAHADRRCGGVSSAEFAGAVMQELEAAGDDVLEFSHPGFNFSSQDVETAAVRSPWRPPSKKLVITSSGSWQDRRYVARFERDPAADVPRHDVAVPARVARFHSVAIAYRDDPDRHEVTRASLSRASRIVHAIAVEAERRGHALSYTSEAGRDHGKYRSSLSSGQFVADIGGHRFSLRLTEVSKTGGASMDYLQASSKPRWQRSRQTMFVATGRLSIAVTGWSTRSGRKERFTDGKRTSLDGQLGDLFWELEVRALERDEHDREQARAAELRRQQRDQALERAKVKLVEADRVAQLHARAIEWADHERLRVYARAVADRIEGDDQISGGAAEWHQWVEAHLADIDPLREPPSMPVPPEPTEENMRPHLQGWSLFDR